MDDHAGGIYVSCAYAWLLHMIHFKAGLLHMYLLKQLSIAILLRILHS